MEYKSFHLYIAKACYFPAARAGLFRSRMRQPAARVTPSPHVQQARAGSASVPVMCKSKALFIPCIPHRILVSVLTLVFVGRNACAQVSGSRDVARPTAGLLGGGVAEAVAASPSLRPVSLAFARSDPRPAAVVGALGAFWSRIGAA